jgi:hypothetical protein
MIMQFRETNRIGGFRTRLRNDTREKIANLQEDNTVTTANRRNESSTTLDIERGDETVTSFAWKHCLSG